MERSSNPLPPGDKGPTLADPDLSRFAVNLEMWWPHLDRGSRVAEAAQAGFEWVEIWFWRNWDIDGLARRLDEHGLRLAQFGAWDFEPSLADRANHNAFQAAIREAVDVADRLDCRLVNLNGPYHEPHRQRDDEVAAVVEALRLVAPLVEAAEITLMVEPMNVRVDHPGYTLPASDDVIEICAAVGSDHVKVNWDLYHLHISEGDLTGHLAAGMDRVGYVQIADHPGRHEPGTGEIRYEYLLPRIADLGYKGVIGLECSPLNTPAEAIERIKRVVDHGPLPNLTEGTTPP